MSNTAVAVHRVSPADIRRRLAIRQVMVHSPLIGCYLWALAISVLCVFGIADAGRLHMLTYNAFVIVWELWLGVAALGSLIGSYLHLRGKHVLEGLLTEAPAAGFCGVGFAIYCFSLFISIKGGFSPKPPLFTIIPYGVFAPVLMGRTIVAMLRRGRIINEAQHPTALDIDALAARAHELTGGDTGEDPDNGSGHVDPAGRA